MIAYRLRWLRRFLLCRYRNFFPPEAPAHVIRLHEEQEEAWARSVETLKKKGIYEAWLKENQEKIEASLGLVDPPPARCLELGCESGWFGKKILDRFAQARYIGVDFRRQPALEFSRGFFVCGDAEKLPVKAGYVDLLIARHVMEHIVDLRAFRRELHRVLCAGGKVLVALPLGYFYDPCHRRYYMSPFGWRFFLRRKLGLRCLKWTKTGKIFEEFICYLEAA